MRAAYLLLAAAVFLPVSVTACHTVVASELNAMLFRRHEVALRTDGPVPQLQRVGGGAPNATHVDVYECVHEGLDWACRAHCMFAADGWLKVCWTSRTVVTGQTPDGEIIKVFQQPLQPVCAVSLAVAFDLDEAVDGGIVFGLILAGGGAVVVVIFVVVCLVNCFIRVRKYCKRASCVPARVKCANNPRCVAMLCKPIA